MMGVLAGIEDAAGFDLRECEYFVGTSAGSIVAARLVGGASPRRPDVTGTELEPARTDGAVAGVGTTALTAAKRPAHGRSPPGTVRAAGTRRRQPGGALIRATVLRRLPRPQRTLDELRAPRRGLPAPGSTAGCGSSAVDRRRGRRVVFGSPGAPRATVAEAVAASCTVPWLFAPVEIGGREYVDGGVWSPTNLDVAPAGARHPRPVLEPDRRPQRLRRRSSPFARRLARSAVSVEALALRRRGAVVRTVAPDWNRPRRWAPTSWTASPGARVLAAGYRQGLALARDAPLGSRERLGPRLPSPLPPPPRRSRLRTAFDSART